MKHFVAAGCLLWSACHLGAQTVKVSGIVTDSSSSDVLPGAGILISDGSGMTADSQGRFTFDRDAGRPLTFTVSYVGYMPRIYSFTPVKDTLLTVSLTADNRLAEVQIYGSRKNFSVEDSQMSAVALSAVQIKSMPALFGETDVMKSLQRLPGVQAANDGNSGIFVRGGDYDQNLITLDGSTLYNSEHLKGFVSALNADMIDNILFYKGAFPARYGARLSSVVDIGMREGDFEKYGGSITLGLLSSRIQAEGPIVKGSTSFNISARMSYFDAIVQPLLEKVYDKPEALRPYSNMNYYDIDAKLVHKFSGTDKLSAVFYWGMDRADSAPTKSSRHNERHGSENSVTDESLDNSTLNSWGNIVSSLFWTHTPGENFWMNSNLSYSRYSYRLKFATESFYEKYSLVETPPGSDEFEKGALSELHETESYAQYNSGIEDGALTVDFNYRPVPGHNLRWGAKISAQRFNPVVNVHKYAYDKELVQNSYVEKLQQVDTLLGSKLGMTTATVYADDDWTLGERWKINAGLRYTMYGVKDKTYHSLEPRISLRYLLTDRMALRASYSRMAQGIHLLSSSNLVMSSDIWVPVTSQVPLMTGDQWAAGYQYTMPNGIDLSVESWYKTSDNVIEYREGASYMSANGDWQDLICIGNGEAYGAEFMLHKKTGRTTGWIGYTWSKSMRQFDRPGQEISGGRKFYAGNDRRNNLNIVISHRFNKHWEISGIWTYQTGRRGIISTTALYGGSLDEYNPWQDLGSADIRESLKGRGDRPDGAGYFRRYLRLYTYSERNGYKLPDVHRLDLGVTYTLMHDRSSSVIGLTVINVYNRMNVSNVYIGYEGGETVLKGVCMFPFMPSLNYTLNF